MSLFTTLRARWRPERAAVTTRGRTWTYEEIDERALRAAGWLANQGVTTGDVVAVRLGKELLFLDLHLGCLALGATMVPIPPGYTPREVQILLSDSGAVITVDASAEEAITRAKPIEPRPLPSDTIAMLLYTSGTTGQPKGAMISHGNLEAMVSALHHAWRWHEADVLLHALPLFHVHGLFVAQHGAMWAGAHAIWLERFDADVVANKLSEATVFMGVPTFYHRLIGHLESERPPARQFPEMRLFTSGSAPLPAADHAVFEKLTGHRILERYGMTEIGIVMSNPYDGERRPGSVGFPLPGVRMRVADERDEGVEAGVIGEVQIAGPSVFGGYLNREEATADALRGGWMHTGDLGFVDPGGYLHLVGRSTDMVLSGGMNVYPSEVEAVLRETPGIEEAAVFGVPDPDLGERVAAAVIPANGWEEEVWMKIAKSKLAPHKVPRAWFRLDALPRNAMGKVQKALLRARFAPKSPEEKP